MQVTELSVRGFSGTRVDELRPLIDRLVRRLDHHSKSIIACRVALDRNRRQQRSGSPYRVRVEITLAPDLDLVVDRDGVHGHLDETVEYALRQAFHTMERKLEFASQKRRGDVKRHVDNDERAFVVRLFPERGYGFLRTVGGQEIYFHRNAVVHHEFDRLSIGTQVRYVGSMGHKGPQASTVKIIDKPGVRVGSRPREQEQEVPMGWER
jgi:cold shock CspA family protein